MNSITLNDDEILAINTFVSELSENPVVEGITLFANYDLNKKPIISIIVIRNISLQYSSKVSGHETIPKRTLKLKEIDKIVAKYNFLFQEKRLSFEITNIDDYNVSLPHEKEMRSKKILLCSTILFDRFDDIKEKQERFEKYISKYINLPEVSNISEIISNDTAIIQKIKES